MLAITFRICGKMLKQTGRNGDVSIEKASGTAMELT